MKAHLILTFCTIAFIASAINVPMAGSDKMRIQKIVAAFVSDPEAIKNKTNKLVAIKATLWKETLKECSYYHTLLSNDKADKKIKWAGKKADAVLVIDKSKTNKGILGFVYDDSTAKKFKALKKFIKTTCEKMEEDYCECILLIEDPKKDMLITENPLSTTELISWHIKDWCTPAQYKEVENQVQANNSLVKPKTEASTKPGN